MNNLKVCFIGLGSIAKRHIRNLQQVANNYGIDLVIDVVRKIKKDDVIDKELNIKHIYTDYSDVPYDYDVIFITNPTKLHIETLKKFANNGKHFFIEKPVATYKQIEEVLSFIPNADSVYYVACPLRYNSVIQYIRNHVNIKDVLSVRCISSSYLPDWRYGIDYRDTYSASKDQGGGVSIDLIHEWDYITYLYGFPKDVKAVIGKNSALEIDSDDFAIYIGEYDKMTVELHLDYYGRVPIREIQIITTFDTIIGDLIHGTLTYLKDGKLVSLREERDDYQKKELISFLGMINGNENNYNSIDHAVRVLRLASGKKG